MTITTDQAFQWIFDNAESIKMVRRPVVAQTVARDGTTRAVSRGANVWRFVVKMPDGYRYSEYRDYLAALDFSDRYTTANITVANPTWLTEYRGDCTPTEISNITANITSTSLNTLTLGNLNGITNGLAVVKQGDFLQLKSGGNPRASVYTVTSDVIKSGNTATVTLNRPLLNWNGNTSTTYGIAVGTAVRWKVLCLKMPAWTVTPNQLIVWDSEFEFIEDLVEGRSGNI